VVREHVVNRMVVLETLQQKPRASLTALAFVRTSLDEFLCGDLAISCAPILLGAFIIGAMASLFHGRPLAVHLRLRWLAERASAVVVAASRVAVG
jgi:hypothetical protein